jgi:hypothetical protein
MPIAMTKSEFWFSIAWLRTSGGNVPQGRVNGKTRARAAWGAMRWLSTGQFDSIPVTRACKVVGYYT